MTLREELKKRDKQISDLKDLLRDYKAEWESACERWKASNERVKELEQAIKNARYELSNA